MIGGDVLHAPREVHAWRWYTAEELAAPEVAEDVRVLGRRAIALIGADDPERPL